MNAIVADPGAAEAMLPLLSQIDDTVIAWVRGQPVTRAEFVEQVFRLAVTLPDQRYVINLADDRYRFTVGFCATMLRNQVTLLPANRAPETLQNLGLQYPDCYRLFASPYRCDNITAEFGRGGHAGGLAIPMIPGKQTVAIAFTSGTTGESRPQTKTWATLRCAAENIKRRFAFESANILATVPFQHMYGLETSVCLPLVGVGGGHAGQPLFPADICSALEDLPAPRLLVTTPIHLRALLLADLSLPPLSGILSATAPLPKALAADAERRFDVPVYEIYGFSEAGSVATRRTIEDIPWRLLDGLSFSKLGDADLQLNAPYLPEPVPFPDVVTRCGPEHIELHGRGSDVVNIAGHRASLQELNHQLQSIAGVQDGIFLPPQDDSRLDARLLAFVVAPGYLPTQILAALQPRIDPAFLPRPLYLVAKLPRNATGKLTQEAIQQLLVECESAPACLP